MVVWAYSTVMTWLCWLWHHLPVGDTYCPVDARTLFPQLIWTIHTSNNEHTYDIMLWAWVHCKVLCLTGRKREGQNQPFFNHRRTQIYENRKNSAKPSFLLLSFSSPPPCYKTRGKVLVGTSRMVSNLPSRKTNLRTVGGKGDIG